MANPTWNDVMKFSLRSNPIIFDVGGYLGDWTQIALDKYQNPTIYIFEPVKSFYDQIVSRYRNNSKVKIYNFGLSAIDAVETISIEGDSSSVFKPGTEQIQLKNIRNFLIEEQIFHVDLIKINIEGEEYRLLSYLTQYPELNCFKNYLIQFHKFINGYQQKRQDLIQELSVYYARIFNYEMIFEGWTMKKSAKMIAVGDSHISMLNYSSALVPEKIENITSDNILVYRTGPNLARNLIEKEDIIDLISRLTYSNTILYCYGEIDCRAQVHRFIDTKSYNEIVDETIDRYFQFIEKTKKDKVIILSIAPEFKERPHWYYYQDHLQEFDCPTGSLLDRTKYKEYFNLKLELEAKKRNYRFISIYNYFFEDTKTKDYYLLDDIHLNPAKVYYLIQRELIKNNITE